jgi:hypothetical protein
MWANISSVDFGHYIVDFSHHNYSVFFPFGLIERKCKEIKLRKSMNEFGLALIQIHSWFL